jgi:hypothetical protein
VILHGEAGSGKQYHSREADWTRLWWIQGAISATLTAVGVGKTTTKGPLQWGFNEWIFYSFTQTMSFIFVFLFCFLLSRITMATIYYQYMCQRKYVA